MYRDISIEELRLNKPLGYYYFLDKSHPLAKGSADVVYYHRHVMSMNIGRWLSTEEHVHHINGNKLDNDIANLELLSRSEHSKLHNPGLPLIFCYECNTTFKPSTKSSKYCSQLCFHKSRSSNKDMDKDTLEKLIWEEPFTTVAKLLGLSDNGVRKLASRLGCIMPPTRFHVLYKDKTIKRELYNKAKVNES